MKKLPSTLISLLLLLVCQSYTTASECSKDLMDEQESDFLALVEKYKIPEGISLPDDISTDPISTYENDVMHQGRIINGNEANIKNFPYQAFLTLYFPNDTMACGGSIVNEYLILTAAHCTKGAYYVKVSVGADNIKDMIYQTTSHIINFPEFNKTTLQHDIALIRLCKPLVFNEFVQAIRLPDSKHKCEDFANKTCTVSGFGRTKFNETRDYRELRYTTVKTMSNMDCLEKWPWMATPMVICTSSLKTAPCMGDSGGPLVVKDPKGEHLIQIGIVSFGFKDCATRPSVYTRIQAYLPWIKKYIHDIK